MAAPLALPLGEEAILDAIRREAHPLTGGCHDYDPLMARVGDARIVLLGEGSHGTHEFYRERARITKRLIAEHGFCAVAIEGDWPDAHRVSRYIRGAPEARDAEEGLRGFRRFPTWMWRNADVLDLVGWLRAHNDGVHQTARKVGFYGLDLYSLGASMEAVIAYLGDQDPDAAARARARYECLQPYVGESAAYGQAVLAGVSEPCRRRVLEELVELRRSAGEYLRRDGIAAEDEQFFAEQNAAVVTDAEEYYRTMFGDRAGSWNLRDRHMADTLDELLAHLDRHGGTARVVVWAHNSHVGDARATEMSQRGELNIGQLMRERHGRDVVNVGFTTYMGTVTAAGDWGRPAERKQVRRALPDSYEALLHASRIPALLLCPLAAGDSGRALREPRLERAIGVIYRPQTERESHYFAASAALQFDALVHVDHTRAVEPLERTPAWTRGEPPETYPSAL
ncbi:erythromycin esterase family protein [Baekduia soli]|uniref:Erythromycin esterase family protein n=1 Tax=Baekduia soli TaxID=496014 RepID=A0A5B8U8H1_9ACTN|nr:erythromycin esterase family protein [Baekduia soli]QEC49423.1 erythromycin esterase family protein [Baekduia soli]